MDYPGKEAWSFEAFVVAESDEIAQWHHDLEDALRGNAMSGTDVCKAISKNLSGIMSSGDMSMLQNLKNRKLVDRKYVTDISRIVVNTLVNRLIECSFENLNYLWEKYAVTPDSKNDFFLHHSWDEPEIKEAISLSLLEQADTNVSSLKKQYPSIISEKIHHSREVERMNAKGKYIIKKLFQAYFSHPQQLPDSVIIQYMIDVKQYKNVQSVAQVGTGAVRAKFEKFYTNRNAYNLEHKISLMRRICDHIAGMTDHYAIEEYNNLYG